MTNAKVGLYYELRKVARNLILLPSDREMSIHKKCIFQKKTFELPKRPNY
jgi:hypothetical protein